MNKDILLFVDALAREKNVEKEIVFSALEAALALATKKRFKDEDADIVVQIDRQTGEYRCKRRWVVVPNEAGLQNPDREELLMDAQEVNPAIQVGEYVEEELEGDDLGRIGAQVAKQTLMQKIRDAERQQMIDELLDRGEKIVSGIVKRLDKGDAIVEIGKVEARLPRNEMIPRENMRTGDRVRAYIARVDRNSRSQSIILTRTSPEFLRELFVNEVPEIEQGLLEIKAASRDPGVRAKIAVVAYDKRIDPIGTCVGMRGSRVSAVRNELGGEQIDIVIWSDDPAEFAINALSPATVQSIELDEDERVMNVIVDEENLPKAIGSRGQNVRLASELIGWQINILTSEESQNRQEKETIILRNMFVNQLDVDVAIADILIESGFTSLEEVAYVPEEELLEIDDFDEELVGELRQRARSALQDSDDASIAVDQAFLDLKGMTPEVVEKLAEARITTLDDLADLSTDELVQIAKISEEDAADLILKARAHWFEEENK
ncbi:transcription termination factor NusA [Basilea psittacipulmonis]|uniref:Transcription termination/antitermination protein NusA n=1 Tax=Basilea psittacipulmonis DSM 24701 TaxID=1072685 RepID=A0A077DEI9_9BURK|nr:transcription termination factor NusA [Basilea psittacipulmonis]AIL33149.1 transcription elongation factor NusA [Basilea psittacipulmonis DSM 24701]